MQVSCRDLNTEQYMYTSELTEWTTCMSQFQELGVYSFAHVYWSAVKHVPLITDIEIWHKVKSYGLSEVRHPNNMSEL